MSDTQLPSDQVQGVWQEVCQKLQTQLTPAVYNTWILSNPLSQIEITSATTATATFTCLTAFHATNLKKNLYLQLRSSLEESLQKTFELQFLVGTATKSTELNSASGINQNQNAQPQNQTSVFSSAPQRNTMSPTVDELFSSHTIQASLVDRAQSRARQIGLRADYIFKNFAVSTTNEMAHAAASAVSNNPGQAYNPLFLYGGVGVGKTHLMHAIGHNILQRDSDTNILYCTGEEFTNEIVSAIQTKKAFDFKKKYRNTQVLLIDDVQFIAGKNAVQEEFFHTFNALTKQFAQIVLTSDRPPHEINLLEDRLRSRFEAGLMIDIQQPSFELRTAILLIKSAAVNITLPMELAQDIASRVDSARKIEGVITLLRSEVELKKSAITQELINKILQNGTPQENSVIHAKPGDVIKTVANHFRVKQSAIKGQRRTKELVKARHVAMFLLRSELKMPLEEIGKWFTDRDHTSVMHATQKIFEQIDVDHHLKQEISALRMSLSVISD